MARVTIKMPTNFMESIENLADKEDEVAERALQAGAEVVYREVKSNLSSVVGKDTKYESRSTGQLESALGISGVLVDSSGNHNIKVGFAENRSDGRSNAMIANILEYGKSGQAAKPFLKPAKTASRKECISAMEDIYLEEIKT